MCLFAQLPLLCRMQLLQLRYLSAHWLVRSHRLQACLPRWIVPFEAQTVERKYPDLSNIGFSCSGWWSSLLDAPTSQANGSWAPSSQCVQKCSGVMYCIHRCTLRFLGTQCLPVVFDGLCSRMIDGLLSLYWVLFTRRRVIWGDFDKVWQNTGDGFALGKLYLMGRQGWRERSFSVYHTSIKMIVSVCFASIKLFSSYNTDWSH